MPASASFLNDLTGAAGRADVALAVVVGNGCDSVGSESARGPRRAESVVVGAVVGRRRVGGGRSPGRRSWWRSARRRRPSGRPSSPASAGVGAAPACRGRGVAVVGGRCGVGGRSRRWPRWLSVGRTVVGADGRRGRVVVGTVGEQPQHGAQVHLAGAPDELERLLLVLHAGQVDDDRVALADDLRLGDAEAVDALADDARRRGRGVAESYSPTGC